MSKVPELKNKGPLDIGRHVEYHSPERLPYFSEMADKQAWRDITSKGWEELGLPEALSPDPAWEPTYLRWGDFPDGGRSVNYLTHKLEPGVTVFRAYKSASLGYPDAYWVDLQESVTLAILHVRLSASDRRLYRVSGTEIGTGDGG